MPRLFPVALLVLLLGPSAPLAAQPLAFTEALLEEQLDFRVENNVVLSPDGATLYVAAGESDDQNVAVYRREAATGRLHLVQRTASHPPAGSTVGQTAQHLALSPDGAHLYGVNGPFFVSWRRDAASGLLTLVQGNQSLSHPPTTGRMLAVAPDGAHAYLTAGTEGNSRLFLLGRDATTGALAVEASYGPADGPGAALATPAGVAVSPDGAHVYVAAYDGDAVHVFRRDAATGALTHTPGGAAGVDGAFHVVVSPDGAHVYVAATVGDRVAVYTRNADPASPAFGALTFLAGAEPGAAAMDAPRSLALSADGHALYAAGQLSHTVAAFARDADPASPGYGTLTFVEAENGGGGEPFAFLGVAASPDGAHLYAAAGLAGTDGPGALVPEGVVVAFGRDGATAALSPAQAVYDEDPLPLLFARGVAVEPGGQHVYVLGTEGPTGQGPVTHGASLLTRDPATGRLTPAGFFACNPTEPAEECVLLDLAFTPDGTRAVGYGCFGIGTGACPGTLFVFIRDAATGALTLDQTIRDSEAATLYHFDDPNAIALSPTGPFAFVTGEDAVTAFVRSAAGPWIHFGDTDRVDNPALTQAEGVAVSPDGQHVYVTAPSRIVVLSPPTSSISGLPVRQVVRDTDPGVEGLGLARDVAVSPDGRHVYVVGAEGATLVTLARDAATGHLTFVSSRPNGVGGLGEVPSLTRYRLAMSPDGARLFLAADLVGSSSDPLRDGLAVFGRDATTGALTPEQVVRHLDGGVYGLNGLTDVAVSADGRHVYTSAAHSYAVATFGHVVVTAAEAPAGGAPGRLWSYPNPFAGRTTLAFDLPASARVRLAVYDVLGREVAVLVDGAAAAGAHEMPWTAAGLPGGVYVVRLEAAGRAWTHRVVVRH